MAANATKTHERNRVGKMRRSDSKVFKEEGNWSIDPIIRVSRKGVVNRAD